MQIEQQVCTEEQSEKLKALGVPQESLFYHTHSKWGIMPKYSIDVKGYPTSAYTVAELLELIPFGYTLIHNGYANKDGIGTLIFDVYETPHIDPGIDHRDDPPTPYGRKCVTPTDWFLKSFNGWAEAAAEFLIYLLENNLHSLTPIPSQTVNK